MPTTTHNSRLMTSNLLLITNIVYTLAITNIGCDL
jgi:hypothetical protein